MRGLTVNFTILLFRLAGRNIYIIKYICTMRQHNVLSFFYVGQVFIHTVIGLNSSYCTIVEVYIMKTTTTTATTTPKQTLGV